MGAFSGTLSKDEVLQSSSKAKFIKSLNDGQVSDEQFNEYLAQEYLLTTTYKDLITYIHSRAPVLQGGLWQDAVTIVNRELQWGESKLKERGVSIESIKPLPDTLILQQILKELNDDKKTYFSLATAVYAMELFRYETWKLVKNPDYKEFVDRWGAKEAVENVGDLETLVDLTAKIASQNEEKEARQIWESIMKCEAKVSNVVTNNTSS